MSTKELRKVLIEQIQKTDNQSLLEEICRLFQIESEDLDIYKLSLEQRQAIFEAKMQIEKGEFLTEEQANSEIDTWLKE